GSQNAKSLQFRDPSPSSRLLMTAPHPPFGHLLPACGEKGNKSRCSYMLPRAPHAVRGWREAPGEGRSLRSRSAHRAVGRLRMTEGGSYGSATLTSARRDRLPVEFPRRRIRAGVPESRSLRLVT